MESSYFLGIFELFMIFQDLGNIIFRAVHISKFWVEAQTVNLYTKHIFWPQLMYDLKSCE